MKIFLLALNLFILTLPESSFAQTEDEWYKNCMAPATVITGWHYTEIKKTVKIKVSPSDLTCDYGYQNFFGGDGQTYVGTKINTPMPMDKLFSEKLAFENYFAGKVERQVACQKIDELKQLSTTNDGVFEIEATIKRFRQDWTQPGNVDVHYMEQIEVAFPNGLVLSGVSVINLDGELCQYDKKP